MSNICWKMSCLQPISNRDGCFFTKLVQIYHWEMQKNWIDFGDLDLIFKVAGGQRMLIYALSPVYLLNGWMDFNQTCIMRLHEYMIGRCKRTDKILMTFTPFSRSQEVKEC